MANSSSNTPTSIPEYACGHSTCSASAAEALAYVFGDNFAYTDTTETEFGIASRSFISFRQATLKTIWHRSVVVSNIIIPAWLRMNLTRKLGH